MHLEVGDHCRRSTTNSKTHRQSCEHRCTSDSSRFSKAVCSKSVSNDVFHAAAGSTCLQTHEIEKPSSIKKPKEHNAACVVDANSQQGPGTAIFSARSALATKIGEAKVLPRSFVRWNFRAKSIEMLILFSRSAVRLTPK